MYGGYDHTDLCLPNDKKRNKSTQHEMNRTREPRTDLQRQLLLVERVTLPLSPAFPFSQSFTLIPALSVYCILVAHSLTLSLSLTLTLTHSLTHSLTLYIYVSFSLSLSLSLSHTHTHIHIHTDLGVITPILASVPIYKIFASVFLSVCFCLSFLEREGV